MKQKLLQTKQKLKGCWRYLLIPLLGGAAVGIFSGGGMQTYATLPKPPLSPPGWVFGVVWSILYLCMGIAACLVAKSDASGKKDALQLFWIQLAVNFIWSILFFVWQMYGFAFLWLLLLWGLVAATLRKFWKIDKRAGWLLVPYLLWITFAAYLNGAIAFAM